MPGKKPTIRGNPAAKKPKKGTGVGKKTARSKTGDFPEWYSIRDVEQLNAIAKPIRQKILAEFVDQPRTTKQVAERLGEPATRLYHHVDELAKNGLLILEREVPKRGTTEKYYRAVARQFRIDESCLFQPQFADKKSRLVAQMLEDARIGLFESLSGGADAARKHTTAVSALVKTTEKRIEKLSESLLKPVGRATEQSDSSAKKEPQTNYRVMILIFPEPEDIQTQKER